MSERSKSTAEYNKVRARVLRNRRVTKAASQVNKANIPGVSAKVVTLSNSSGFTAEEAKRIRRAQAQISAMLSNGDK